MPDNCKSHYLEQEELKKNCKNSLLLDFYFHFHLHVLDSQAIMVETIL